MSYVYIYLSLYLHITNRCLMLHISDLKIEVTFPRPGDTFVPPALQSQWIRVASRPGQVPQTNPTNIVCM